jgi:hypothetical protein
MKLATLVLSLSLVTIPTFGDNLYTWSTVALGGANTLDTISSVGKMEANPALRGGAKFGWQSTLIKGGIVGGTLVMERYILHRHPTYTRAITITNFVVAGGLGAISIHNAGVKK